MSEWPRYYILVDRLPVAVDWMTWAQWFEKLNNRVVAKTTINKGCGVSTVFLGLDHNLFETMVFGGPLDGERWRYSTWAQAERGHQHAVTQARIAAARIKSIADDAGI